MTQSILVVDDDPDTLTLIGLTLQRRGFEVLKAQSGTQALNMLTHDAPDLIILDVMMPQMDGYEVCREIKADPRVAHLPVVMLTAKAQTASQIEGFRAGAIDYITKPVHPQDLIARIQAVLEKAQVEPAAHGAHVIAVTGVKGGVGATTLAVNLALAAAAGARAIIVDFEPGGAVAIHLGLEPAQTIDDLMSGDGEPIDVARVEAALTVHTSGLRLLAAADKPIDPSRATILLNHVLGLCDVCVFDLGDGLGPAARTIVQRSNQVVVATDSDRAALTHASKLMHTLSEIGVSSNSVKIVWINRLGTPVDAAQAAIRSTLGRDPIATIGPAAEVMYAALEQARPLILAHPDDPVAIQLTALATALLPHN